MRDRQAQHGERTNQDHDDGNHHGDDGAVDEEFRHGSSVLIDSLILDFFGHEWLWIHSHPVAHSLNTFHNDSVSGIEPVGDDPSVINPVAHSNRSNVNFVVGSQPQPPGSRPVAPTLRVVEPATPPAESEITAADFAVAAGPQNVVWIGKEPGDSNRSCGLVHLAIGKIKLAFVRIDRAVR